MLEQIDHRRKRFTIDDDDVVDDRRIDRWRRDIANADDRPADEIERADPALAGVAAQAFVEETANHAYIYTTDTLAGEGAEKVFTSEGCGDSVTYVNGFRFIDDLLE